MSDNLYGLIASANRRRRAAIVVFGAAIGLASLFPHNDRAMWVPESDTPLVFTAVTEELPVTYLSIGGADDLLNRLINSRNTDPERRLRSRFIPSDPRDLVPQTGGGNSPAAAVPEFADLPTELAEAQTVPGSILNPGPSINGPASRNSPRTPGGIGGGSGGGNPGTVNDPDPVVDPPAPEPPVNDPPIMSPVPEPMTWAMFISGFAMIGAVLRRRRRKVVPA